MNAVRLTEIDKDWKVGGVDQNVILSICVQALQQISLATWAQLQSRFVKEKHAIFESSTAVVHEPQVKRKERAEALRLLFEGDHSNISGRFLNLRKEFLSVTTELNPVRRLPPSSRPVIRQTSSGQPFARTLFVTRPV